MDKVRVTVYIDAAVADALHQASLNAGGYGHKSRIVEEGLRRHPETKDLIDNREKLEGGH